MTRILYSSPGNPGRAVLARDGGKAESLEVLRAHLENIIHRPEQHVLSESYYE